MAQHAAPRPARFTQIRKIAKRVLLTLIGLSVLWCGMAIGAAVANVRLQPVAVQSSTQVPQPRIMEDDPRWDCTTMGNLICGSR